MGELTIMTWVAPGAGVWKNQVFIQKVVLLSRKAKDRNSILAISI